MLKLIFITGVLASTLASTPSIAISYHIEKTWNGGRIDHDPIKITLEGDGKENLFLHIEAPFFNDPPNPGGKPSEPFFGLWNYEVVEAFFLNNDDQYLEVEVAPWGQHIVLLFKGERQTIRHSLPLSVKTTIQGDRWNGTAKIPFTYLPPKVTRFNAYAIHGSEPNRIYEALYPAPRAAANPDFHALQYFSDIDMSLLIPPGKNNELSELWQDALNGLFRYRVTTTWNSRDIEHPPITITLQGFQDGVEMNVTGPLFNDPSMPDAKPGPLWKLWEYEVVEMLFANDKNELLHVGLGPWGHHQVMLVKDFPHTTLKHSLPLDYIASQDLEKNTWKGSALIPPSFFPPSVNRMNAYASHGIGLRRNHEALNPMPADSITHDTNKLEYFKPIDFEFLEPKNPKSDYSVTWSTEDTTPVDIHQVVESETVTTAPEEEEPVTVLGPSRSTNNKPYRQHLLRRLDDSLKNKQQQIASSAPGRDEGYVDERQQQSKEHPLRKKQEEDPLPEEDEPPQVDVFTKEERPQVPVRTKEERPQVDVFTKEERPQVPVRMKEERPQVPVLTKEERPQVTVRTKEERPQVPVLTKEERPLVPVRTKEERPQFPVLTKEERPLVPVPTEEDPFEEPLQDPFQETESPPPEEEDPLHDLIPSIDYIDQSKPMLPAPHPFCFEEGLIRDFIRCQVFHECVVENNEWRVYHWRCPRGQYFDQEKIACLPGFC